MSKNVLLFCLIIFLFGCGNVEEEIKTTFNSIRNFKDAKSTIELLDEGSILYFSEMGKVAGRHQLKPYDVKVYCENSLYPLSTRYMIQVLKMMAPSDSSSIIELEDVISIASLADFGPIGIDNRNRYRFHKLERSGDRMARAIINYQVNPAKRTYVQSSVLFSKREGEGWKMNYQETLSFFEKYLSKLRKESSGSDDEFIQNIIINGGKDVEFKY